MSNQEVTAGLTVEGNEPDYDTIILNEILDEDEKEPDVPEEKDTNMHNEMLEEDEDEDDDEKEEEEVPMVETAELELPKASKIDIEMYHPKLKQHNYEEILMRANIQRNEKGEIQDPYHQTVPVLSRYERARIIGARAKQINYGAKPLVEVPQTMIDGYKIAEKELETRVIPFIIRRPLPNGNSEYWRVSDLQQIDY